MYKCGSIIVIDKSLEQTSTPDFVMLCVGEDEDDGHLVTFTQSQTSGASEMRVYSAKTMDETPVASVELPIRCPSGFHCFHMSEEQFQAQGPTMNAKQD